MTFVTIIAATAMALLAVLDLARRAEIARQLERSTLEARHRGLSAGASGPGTE